MLRSVFSLLLSLFKSHTQPHIEVLFLRKQLEIVARSSPRLRVSPAGRFFIGILTDLYDSWKEALLIVKPETVIRWHRQSFRLFWKRKSRSGATTPEANTLGYDVLIIISIFVSLRKEDTMNSIITINPGRRSGKPCIRDLRITVYDILEYLASGMSSEQILADFPELTKEDIIESLRYAADRERKTVVIHA